MLSETGFFPRLVNERLVFPDLAASTVEEALAELSAGLARAGLVKDAGDLARRLSERERLGSTGLGGGVAIPHCKTRDLADVLLAVGVSRKGIDFGAADGVPVTLIFLVVSPSDAPGLHLQALARISRVIRMPGVADDVRQAATAGEIPAVLKTAEGRLPVPA
ncbi:MAG TPA: PTS sugar transporter subunit IIA [Thermoanaerobaculia bacterium]|nr:PTS sugar transporter subunit IIA [Thermoanaerobaculia bacterium]